MLHLTDIRYTNSETGTTVGKINGRDAITLDHGKYTVLFGKTDSFPEQALRGDEPYRNLTGDNLIFWMAAVIRDIADHA